MIDIRQYFAPKASDVPYICEDALMISMILHVDSYKIPHAVMYPNSAKRKVIAMSSYGESRGGGTVVSFGMQMYIKMYLTKRITMEHIDAAERFAIAHFGRNLFHRAAWEKVVNEYNGFLPIVIRALPEGTVTHSGIPVYTVTCFDEDLFWLAQNIETSILRGVWYPSTIASYDYDIKKEIKHFYVLSGADLSFLPFTLHDFGARGCSSGETAQIGGASHLLNFMGSDTIEGILAANFYYKSDMAGFSVPATEHSIECSFKLDCEGEREYLLHTIKTFMAPNAVISIVIDGKDVYRAADTLCNDPEIKALIIELGEMGGKVVFRPDSGDMMETVPRILMIQEKAFGSTVNAQGYRKINYVGVIQGDGIDRQGLAIKSLLGKIMSMGFRPDNLVFGSGGGLLQAVGRDDKRWAQKGSGILVRYDDGSTAWEGIAKDPVTDPGKRSKEGVLTTVRWKMTGELMSVRLDELEGLSSEFEDAMILMYHEGTLYNETTLDEARERCLI